jgi:two-component system sensor histidine kinase CiaH
LIHAVDKESFYSLVYNIAENAVKYSTENQGLIDIELKSFNGSILLIVKDQGIGIPVSEKSKVFDQFYRIGQEEVRSSKGTGLGLYIANQIAKAHSGKISISDNNPSGSVFTVQFPKQS